MLRRRFLNVWPRTESMARVRSPGFLKVVRTVVTSGAGMSVREGTTGLTDGLERDWARCGAQSRQIRTEAGLAEPPDHVDYHVDASGPVMDGDLAVAAQHHHGEVGPGPARDPVEVRSVRPHSQVGVDGQDAGGSRRCDGDVGHDGHRSGCWDGALSGHVPADRSG